MVQNIDGFKSTVIISSKYDKKELLVVVLKRGRVMEKKDVIY